MRLIKIRYFLLITLWGIVLAAGMAGCKNKDIDVAERPDRHDKRPQTPAMAWEKTYESAANADTLGKMTELIEYDSLGNMVHNIKYDTVVGKVSDSRFTYNDKGKQLTATIGYNDGNTMTETNTYDDRGRLQQTEWKNTSGPNGRHVYGYDEKDALVRWEWYENGAIKTIRVYPIRYNEAGRKIYEGYGELRDMKDTIYVNEKRYDYDSSGLLTASITYEKAAPTHTETYVYDSLDNNIMEIHRDKNDSNMHVLSQSLTVQRSFNKYGEVVLEQRFVEGRPFSSTVYTYDQYGHMLSSRTSYASGQVEFVRKEYGYRKEEEK